ncbi:MAG: hypothetical protein R3B41_03160 [Candidatus Doudnabacteria bacterium]
MNTTLTKVEKIDLPDEPSTTERPTKKLKEAPKLGQLTYSFECTVKIEKIDILEVPITKKTYFVVWVIPKRSDKDRGIWMSSRYSTAEGQVELADNLSVNDGKEYRAIVSPHKTSQKIKFLQLA